MSPLEWLQETSTVVSITWSQTSTTLILLVADSRRTGLENVRMHASRVLLIRLSDSCNHRMLSEGDSPDATAQFFELSLPNGAPHVQLHPQAIKLFWEHACYLSRLSAPLDTAALQNCIAEGNSLHLY